MQSDSLVPSLLHRCFRHIGVLSTGYSVVDWNYLQLFAMGLKTRNTRKVALQGAASTKSG
jgi:hypothetical protein